jgi:hypothetical protein
MGITATDFMPPAYDDVIAGFGIDMAGCAADCAESQHDRIGQALHRLVQSWRLHAPHLRFLLEMMGVMQDRKRTLNHQLRIMDPATGPAALDECQAASYGAASYAGCVALLLSGLLLRFRDDLGVGWPAWNTTAPLYRGHSFGQIIAAAANGFRHDDEWAPARPAKPQQYAIRQRLATVLGGQHQSTPEPGRCPEVLDLLGGGRGFDGLTENLFAFARNVAAHAQAALPG